MRRIIQVKIDVTLVMENVYGEEVGRITTIGGATVDEAVEQLRQYADRQCAVDTHVPKPARVKKSRLFRLFTKIYYYIFS